MAEREQRRLPATTVHGRRARRRRPGERQPAAKVIAHRAVRRPEEHVRDAAALGSGSQAATKLSAALSSAFTHSGRPDRNTATTGTSSERRCLQQRQVALVAGTVLRESAHRRRTPRTGSRRIPRSPHPGAYGIPRGTELRRPAGRGHLVRDTRVDRFAVGNPGSARCPASRSSSRRFAWQGCRRHRR